MTSTIQTRGRCTVALLVAALMGLGIQPAAAAAIPQDATKAEMQEFCELARGTWVELMSGTYACAFPDWNILCDGTTCDIACHDVKCVESARPIGRPELRVPSTGAEDQVVAPVGTPTPTQRKSRTTAPTMVGADGQTTLIIVTTDERR